MPTLEGRGNKSATIGELSHQGEWAQASLYSTLGRGRRPLVLAAPARERTFKNRPLALTFIVRTYDLVRAAIAAKSIEIARAQIVKP